MNKLLIFFTFLLLIVFPSCQVTENITLSDAGNTSEGEIIVSDFFIDVLNDFSQFMATSASDESIMDSAVRDFANGLSSNENNSNVLFSKGEGNQYTLSFDFEDITEALSALGGVENFSVLKGDDHSLSFYLDINNYSELKEMIPFLADPNFEVYGPEFNQGMSEADYSDMIFYLLGEEAPEALQTSLITINFTLPGELTKAEGVTVTGKNSCSYSFPLIDFLLLSKPMSFSISWN